jgi:hypothetical protein
MLSAATGKLNFLNEKKNGKNTQEPGCSLKGQLKLP